MGEKTYSDWALAPGILFIAVSQHLLYLLPQLLQYFKQGQRRAISCPFSLPISHCFSFSLFFLS